jgi:type III restriction enzyme
MDVPFYDHPVLNSPYSCPTRHVDEWRALPNPKGWKVTPETAHLLQHWRTHRFSAIRHFFCQIEAAETLIWLSEVAPQGGKIEIKVAA